MRRLRGSLPSVIGLCALALTVACLLGRESYVIGSAWWALRWPVGLMSLFVTTWSLRRTRWRSAALAGVACALISLDAGSQWIVRASPRPNAGPELTVATHNLLFLGNSLAESIEGLNGTHASVVALQEVTSADATRLIAALAPTHPFHAEAPHAGAHGFALFSQFPLEDVRLVRFEGKLPFAQCATVLLPDGPLPTCNVHLSAPVKELGDLHSRLPDLRGLERNAERRAREWSLVEAELERRGGTRALALGDFNSLEVEPLYAHLRTRWVDAYRHTHLAWGATWPNRSPTPPFARIDYVFTRGDLSPRHAEIVRRSGSDHLAVAATLTR